jgi:hypothetical protein
LHNGHTKHGIGRMLTFWLIHIDTL